MLKAIILPAFSQEDIDSVVYRYYLYKNKRQEGLNKAKQKMTPENTLWLKRIL